MKGSEESSLKVWTTAEGRVVALVGRDSFSAVEKKKERSMHWRANYGRFEFDDTALFL